MKKYLLILLLIILLQGVSARPNLDFNINIINWFYDDGSNNISKFNISINGYDGKYVKDVEIDNENVYIKNDLNDWNETLTLSFDYEEDVLCNEDIDNITETIIEICQTRTEKLENARKEVEINKQGCDTQLSNCTTDKDGYKIKSDKYDSMESSYNSCYTSLNNCTSVRDECLDKQGNEWWWGGIGILIGLGLGYKFNDEIKNLFKWKRNPPETRESPRPLQEKDNF